MCSLWRKLWDDEGGAATTLEFTLALPLLLIAFCLFVEGVLIVLAKCGVTYAAFAAARSAGAWYACQPGEAHRAARRAAVQALVPYSSGDADHRLGPPSPAAQRYAAAVHPRYPPASVAARFAYAEKATTVHVRRQGDGATATVVFQYPVRVPVVGRLLGQRAAWPPRPFTCSIQSTATAPTAAPTSGLGINYVPAR